MDYLYHNEGHLYWINRQWNYFHLQLSCLIQVLNIKILLFSIFKIRRERVRSCIKSCIRLLHVAFLHWNAQRSNLIFLSQAPQAYAFPFKNFNLWCARIVYYKAFKSKVILYGYLRLIFTYNSHYSYDKALYYIRH